MSYETTKFQAHFITKLTSEKHNGSVLFCNYNTLNEYIDNAHVFKCQNVYFL